MASNALRTANGTVETTRPATGEHQGRNDRAAIWVDRIGTTILARTLRKIDRGSLSLTMPDGSVERIEGREVGPSAVMELRRGRLIFRYLRNGAVGFAEGFIAGDFDSPDLADLLHVLASNHEAWRKTYYGPWPSRLVRWYQHWRNDNSTAQAERNIHSHYDLGNEFFSAWLDPSMTYSSALFEAGTADLEAAQEAKYEHLCRMIGLTQGQEVLEIGSGWGGFALHAARHHGAKVTSLTISRAQHELACRRVHEAGLGERIDIRYQDYRDLDGQFDAIASIEMFEAVGERYWPAYFDKLSLCLRPGGRAGLQIITIADAYFDRYRRTADFIQRYIFPGGCLPSISALRREFEKAGLSEKGLYAFGLDYARTLRMWNERFQSVWDDLGPLGFDERFKRIWRYYLAYCEAGFRTGSTDVVQVALARS
ncbi:MAG: cyclopropane-fatty-acyl-phospholipid synthase family protein [Geminicoccaceae bacterium]